MIQSWKPEAPKNGFLMLVEGEDGYAFENHHGLRVIMSGQIENGKKWIHVSMSRKSRMPDYADMLLVKNAFIGENKKAIMIWPEKKFYVNIHPYCLHLWHCVDGDGLPEFSHGLGTI